MEWQLNKAPGSGEASKVRKCLIRGFQCCLACFERCIKFINKNAYIQCAIQSSNFCNAMKDAFYLILKNPALFAITGGLSKLFSFFGLLFITACTTLIGYAIIQKTEGDDLKAGWAPIFVPLLS
jgi:solute carrier family 44 (choline transporter-like protein), member 2/4/5